MRRWLYEHCHWYFFVCVLPLSYLVRFLNYVLQFFSKPKTSRNKNPKGVFSAFWGKSFLEMTCFICQKKNLLTSSRYADEEMTAVPGFWLEQGHSLGGLKPDISMLLLCGATTIKFFHLYSKMYLECSFICLRNREQSWE